MNENKNIFGCFVSGPSLNYDATPEQELLAKQQGELFRDYIWKKKGISDKLKKLENQDYGKDLVLVLFQFYLNPMRYELQGLKEIENYRKNEKSIGIPIIVTDDNFFNKSDEERYNFLQESILQKLNLLAEVVKNKKLDTKIELLQSDTKRILTERILLI